MDVISARHKKSAEHIKSGHLNQPFYLRSFFAETPDVIALIALCLEKRSHLSYKTVFKIFKPILAFSNAFNISSILSTAQISVGTKSKNVYIFFGHPM